MIKPKTYTTGHINDYIDEIIKALKRQDTVTLTDTKNDKPMVVISAQHSFGRKDVMVANGAGLKNIANQPMFNGDFELKIEQLYK